MLALAFVLLCLVLTFSCVWCVQYKVSDGGVYAFGVDPGWYHTGNELAFFNSFKMKLAVTLGVIQMAFGIFLSLANHLYWKDYLHVWFEFVPRLVFLLATFGYMIFIVIFKVLSFT